MRPSAAGRRRQGIVVHAFLSPSPTPALAFGHHPLLDERRNFSLDARERVGLIGRNGSGKSVAAAGHRRRTGEYLRPDGE